MIDVDEFLDLAEEMEKQDRGVIIRFDDHPDLVANSLEVIDIEHGYLSIDRNGQAPFLPLIPLEPVVGGPGGRAGALASLKSG